MVYDSGSGWVTESTIASDTSAWYNTSLSATQISGGKVQIRYVDTNISSDTIQNTLSIDYAGVRSENSTTGSPHAITATEIRNIMPQPLALSVPSSRIEQYKGRVAGHYHLLR